MIRALVVVLGLFLGGWLAYDGTHGLVTGDYVTPSSGEYEGQLGPWSKLVEGVGLEPRSELVMSIHIGLGLLWIAAVVGFVTRAGWGRRGVIASAVLSLWYLPFGTLIGVVIVALLMLPAMRRAGDAR